MTDTTRRSGWMQTAILGLTVLAGLAIVTPIAYSHAEMTGVAAALAAAGLCTAASLGALAFAWLWPQQLMLAVMAGMLIRMFVPLAACLAVTQSDGDWRDAGFIYYVLAFYLLTLAADTLLVVPRPRAPMTGSSPSPNSPHGEVASHG